MTLRQYDADEFESHMEGITFSDGGRAPKARSRSQTIDGNPTWVMYVGMYVWYLELSRELRHVAQQTRYQNVGLRNGHCIGTISSGCDFQPARGARNCQNK